MECKIYSFKCKPLFDLIKQHIGGKSDTNIMLNNTPIIFNIQCQKCKALFLDVHPNNNTKKHLRLFMDN